ncbi:hypothetical protein PCANC_06551 [Puccinia coronata f. sp. avenae]|uniref:Uncharacterized protein n=1 Tax=Puccinia coronata f. sp. avenae TaxID=200324 RepID=A0A2N5VA12_9BASI|nr:hypothetical protein PCANC_06551 [Puccinia coronata f. sp. avenae]
MGRLKSLANLDIYVNFDSAPGFIYTRPWAEDDHLPLKYTFHCFFSSNQLEDYSKQSLNQDSDPLVILSMSRKGSAQTVFPLSCDAVSSHLSDQQLTSRRKLTMLNRPESLLKLQRHSDRFCASALTFSTKEQKRNCKSLRILLGPNHNPCL